MAVASRLSVASYRVGKKILVDTQKAGLINSPPSLHLVRIWPPSTLLSAIHTRESLIYVPNSTKRAHFVRFTIGLCMSISVPLMMNTPILLHIYILVYEFIPLDHSVCFLLAYLVILLSLARRLFCISTSASLPSSVRSSDN